MKRSRSTRAAFALFLATALSACGGAKTASVKPGVMPEGGSFHGVWHSTQFGQLEICDNRGTAIGSFSKDTRSGVIQGKVEGNLMRFSWTEENELVRGRPNVTEGRGYFVLEQNEEGRFRIDGEWGYGDAEIGGGPWAANQIRSARPDNCYANVKRSNRASGDEDDQTPDF